MDQSSSNDTDKRNWRDRLGIGSRDMPRISGEFTKSSQATVVEEKIEVHAAQPVAVAKPAPMAPRVPTKAEGAPPQVGRPNGHSPQSAAPQSSDALAEKLRSQRAAAEKLAEQRVSVAQGRVDNATPSTAKPTNGSTGEKPKFTFAEDEPKPDYIRDLRGTITGRPPQQRPAPQMQLSPPRPALGGERILGAPQRQASPPPTVGYQPQFRPQPSQGYRPIESTNGLRQPPMQRGVTAPPMGHVVAREPRLQTPHVSPPPYMRQPQDGMGNTRPAYEPGRRPAPRQEPVRPRPQALDDDFADEIFEDAPTQRGSRRASATDYNQAYRETEDAYGYERRRSWGPIIIFLALIAGVIILAGAATYWYVNGNTGSPEAGKAVQSAPVVAAPEQAAKVAPEQPAKAGLADEGSAVPSKKEIYDRIIGDREVPGGKVVPTEEVPVQLDSEQIPEPTNQTIQPSADDAVTDEALPLPMPPPPGSTNDTQGAIPTPVAKQTVALAAPTMETESAEIGAPAVDEEIPVVETPKTITNDGAAKSVQATPPSQKAPATEEIAIVDAAPEPAPVKPKVIVKSAEKPKAKTEQVSALGAEPVVLVPPSDTFVPTENAGAPVVAEKPVVAQSQPTTKKKKTLFDLLSGNKDEAAAAETVAAPQAAPKPEVAAVAEQTPQPAPEKKAEPVQVASAATGYYVQLASFRSEAEAKTEYSRILAKHGSIIGNLPPVINPASVGGSTRYRLAVGPLSSYEKADGICKSLFAAGVRDCLVPR